MATTYSKVQLRRGTKAHWTEYNTILFEGEVGFETDTYRFKIGQKDENGNLIAWNDLDYYGNPQTIDEITIEDDIIIGEDACVTGDFNPCVDDSYTLGSETNRWTEANVNTTIRLGDAEITYGPASEATGDTENFLKLNGDDIATRSELERVTTQNLNLAYSQDPIPAPVEEYLRNLFKLLERELPPMDGIQTQSQFNGWVVQALQHVDEIAHQGGDLNDEGDLIIGGPNFDIIIGPDPNNPTDPDNPEADFCKNNLDIYNKTTVHCSLNAKKGINVLDKDGTYFVKADATVSNLLPMEQSYRVNVPPLPRFYTPTSHVLIIYHIL